MPSRLASRYSSAQLTNVTASMNSRPTITAWEFSAKPSDSLAHAAIWDHPKNG